MNITKFWSKITFFFLLSRYCGIMNPSWMELRNFVYFFNKNLLDCENSIFTSADLRTEFPGFKAFVVKFLLEMSRVKINNISFFFSFFTLVFKLNFT